MSDSAHHREFDFLGLILRVLGGAILLGGLGTAFLGPAELYSFYLFSEGGRFHYEGFGFGSFLFAFIAAQIMGYYLIAIAAIPLGYGHLMLRRWARPLMRTLLGFWLVTGLPLTLVTLYTFITFKDPSMVTFLVALPFAFILYPIAPLLLMRFYRSQGIIAAFERQTPEPSWLETIPERVRVLCVLLGFYAIALHIVILLRGVFPMFGVLLSELPGIVAVDAVIWLMLWLVWGLARLKRWAWWGTLTAFALLTLSSLLTFPRYTVADILAQMAFPAYERVIFQNLPFLNSHVTIVAILPLLVTLAVAALAGRDFLRANPGPMPGQHAQDG
jgi:hypothetical protein